MQAEELAKRALGDEAVAEIAATTEKVAQMVDAEALEEMKSSFSAMAESDIPEEVERKKKKHACPTLCTP